MRRTIAVVTAIAALAAAAAPAYAGKNPPDDNAREPFTGAPTKVQVASVESDLVARRSRGFSRSRSDEQEGQEEEGQEEVDGEQQSECGAIGVAPLAIGGLGLAAYRRRRRR